MHKYVGYNPNRVHKCILLYTNECADAPAASRNLHEYQLSITLLREFYTH